MSDNDRIMTRRTKSHRHEADHMPSEDVDMDSGLNLPHMPLHIMQHTEEDGKPHKPYSIEGDRGNIALLTFLYVLQGIPLGLAASIPYLLQSRQVNYKDQAIFSFVYWPFSMKLLWAPIVDSVYVSRIGRRKSWLVPIQYLLGFFMLWLSTHVVWMLGDNKGNTEGVSIVTLTFIFFILNFLAATQDIAVDGWALTMLARRNVAWASTCNSVGQTAGYFMGHVVFMALESANFCNNYLRSTPKDYGIVDLSGFLYMWGIVFLITTTLVMIMKKEVQPESSDDDEEEEHSIIQTYQLLFRIIQLPSVKTLIAILLTVKMGFAAADAVTGLKLIEEGVPRDNLALLGIPMVPLQIVLPVIITRYTTGPQPMNIYLKAMPYRLIMGLEFALVVWWAPSNRMETGEYPVYFYCVVLASYALHQIALYSMFVSMMAFFAKISDPAIGGTYMTLLNTISNFGGNWPSTVALWFVDALTWKTCSGAKDGYLLCSSTEQTEMCTKAEGTCITNVDGYYILSFVCALIGFCWWRLGSKKIRHLQQLSQQDWTCS